MNLPAAVLWVLTGSASEPQNWHELDEFETMTECVLEAKEANRVTRMLGWFQCKKGEWKPEGKPEP